MKNNLEEVKLNSETVLEQITRFDENFKRKILKENILTSLFGNIPFLIW